MLESRRREDHAPEKGSYVLACFAKDHNDITHIITLTYVTRIVSLFAKSSFQELYAMVLDEFTVSINAKMGRELHLERARERKNVSGQ